MSLIDEIKNKIDILDVVQRYVKLKKIGKYYAGLCPFHKETKPSFYVSPEKQIFKCFGCGEGGNVISFLMKIENIDFKEAVEKLKVEYGLEVKPQTFKTNLKKYLEINYASLKFFKENLKNNKEALDYLLERGLTTETIKFFELGYSPGSTFLRDYLYSLGYSIEEMKKFGLLDEEGYDRFQGRIIFPLRNENGELIGFTGRIYPPRERAPKYLNTPETEFFKKSNFLYGLFYSRDYIEEKKEVIIVEGQMDFILSFENGLKNIVAVSGSSLTAEHLKKLKKYTNKLVLAFDNDEAGFKASLRAHLMAKELNFEVYRLVYPEKDLGDYFKKNKNLDALKKEIFLDWLLDELLNQKKTNYEVLNIFLPQIKLYELSVKDKFFNILSQKLKIKKELIMEEYLKIEKESVAIYYQPDEEFVFPQKLEDKLSLKIVSLIFSFPLNVPHEEFYGFLTQEYQIIYEQIKSQNLSEDIYQELDLMKNFYLQTKINPEREFFKTLKELKKIFYKNKIEELKNSLKFCSFEECDKIIKEVDFYVKELKKLEKNA